MCLTYQVGLYRTSCPVWKSGKYLKSGNSFAQSGWTLSAHRLTYIQNDFGLSLGLVLSANGFVIWNLSWTRWCPCFLYLWLLPGRKFTSWFLSVVWSNCMLKKSTGEVKVPYGYKVFSRQNKISISLFEITAYMVFLKCPLVFHQKGYLILY